MQKGLKEMWFAFKITLLCLGFMALLGLAVEAIKLWL